MTSAGEAPWEQEAHTKRRTATEQDQAMHAVGMAVYDDPRAFRWLCPCGFSSLGNRYRCKACKLTVHDRILTGNVAEVKQARRGQYAANAQRATNPAATGANATQLGGGAGRDEAQ